MSHVLYAFYSPEELHIWKCFCPNNFHYNLKFIISFCLPSSAPSRHLIYVDVAKKLKKIPWPLWFCCIALTKDPDRIVLLLLLSQPLLVFWYSTYNCCSTMLNEIDSLQPNSILFFCCCWKCSYNSIKEYASAVTVATSHIVSVLRCFVRAVADCFCLFTYYKLVCVHIVAAVAAFCYFFFF